MGLEIYYTGSDIALAAQTEAVQSLGGYISKTQVPNDFFGNLFPAISQLAKQDKATETRVIAIKNNTNATMTNVEAFISVEDEASTETTWQIGFQVPVVDSCGDLVMDKIPDAKATPMNIAFQDALGIDNKIELGSIPSQGYVGIYLKRTVAPIVVDDDDMLINFEEEVEPIQKEEIDLVFSWT